MEQLKTGTLSAGSPEKCGVYFRPLKVYRSSIPIFQGIPPFPGATTPVRMTLPHLCRTVCNVDAQKLLSYCIRKSRNSPSPGQIYYKLNGIYVMTTSGEANEKKLVHYYTVADIKSRMK